MRAGAGWAEGLVGRATVPAEAGSQAGYTLRDRPVVVEDFAREARFEMPALLRDAGVAAGMSVVIGSPGMPWGVLGAHSRSPRVFSKEEVGFLGTAANILAAAIDRWRNLASMRSATEEYRSLAENIPGLLVRFDAGVRILYLNTAAARASGRPADRIVGMTLAEAGVPERIARTWEQDIRRVLETGERLDHDLSYATPDGMLHFHNVVVPERAEDGTVRSVLSFAHDITERKRAADSLLAAEAKLRAVTARLAAAEEEERKRIARELHDTVCQDLAAAGIDLALVVAALPEGKHDEARRRLEDCASRVEKTARGLREIMAELRPPVLDSHGLAASLRWHGEQCRHTYGAEVDVSGGILLPRLPLEVAMVLFRIAQEAITNAARHAGAARIAVSVMQEAGVVKVEVADDGTGFDTSIEPGGERGWGLSIMRERAAGIGAAFEIDSAPGKGTRVRIEMPRPAAAADEGEA